MRAHDTGTQGAEVQGRTVRDRGGPGRGTPGRADIVIVGAGAAGLSLVLSLARHGVLRPDRRTVLIDPGPDRTGPDEIGLDGTGPDGTGPDGTGPDGTGPDGTGQVGTDGPASGTGPFDLRVWGFWDTARRPVLAGTGTVFPLVRTHASGRNRSLPSYPYRYRVVRGAELRSLTEAVLAEHPQVERLPGTVRSIVDGPDAAFVEHDGGVLEARWVFDSVGLPAVRARPPAVMAFQGWEIRTDRRRLDERVPTLFDFRGLAPGCFGYQVPLGPGRALAEVTRIGPPDDTVLPDPEPYLREVLGLEGYEILRTEHGRLPLDPWHHRPTGRHTLAIGRPAGLLKASSGFALARIQRDSAAVAQSLRRNGHPFALPEPRWRHRLFDAAFLQAVLRDPPLLEKAFGVLAERPARLMRFLDEDSSLGQEVRIALEMPPGGFLRGGARALREAGRRKEEERSPKRDDCGGDRRTEQEIRLASGRSRYLPWQGHDPIKQPTAAL
ncbi:MAG: lycopene beta-cyclase [Actinomycetota bacterium]|nr:lycopene beta-cyclase [Actinomycetota bacterium]